jgi:molybdate transport system regulatory protein
MLGAPGVLVSSRKNPWFFQGFWLFSKKDKAMARKRTDHGRGTALAESPNPAGFKIKGRLWLEKDGEAFLSWGRVVLLERIRELGSIAAAARSMNMAYSHAWTLVAEVNRLAGQELVARTFGGKNGGLAWLTPAGEESVAQFWRLVDTFRDWLQTQKL